MNSIREDIAIVIFANRKDFCLTKICIASIRYFYPTVEIWLVKDMLNGRFNTKRVEKAFNIKILNIGRKYFGWGAAKVHFLLNEDVLLRRYLCLDSDTIFVGKVIEELEKVQAPFIVSAVKCEPPFDNTVTDLYLDPGKVKKYYPDYEYPGYFFNTGQMIVTPRIIDKKLLEYSFDPDQYPFYKNRDAFRLVDQAVLNAMLPVLSKRKNIEIGTCSFMQWSVSFFEGKHNQRFDDIKNESLPYVVHYAGDVRTHQIRKMKGADLLRSFREQYYKKLTPVARIFDRYQDSLLSINVINKVLYKKNRLLIGLKQV